MCVCVCVCVCVGNRYLYACVCEQCSVYVCVVEGYRTPLLDDLRLGAGMEWKCDKCRNETTVRWNWNGMGMRLMCSPEAAAW